jgi:hypothetical protein
LRVDAQHLPARTAAGVPPEPVHQGREVDRVPSGRSVAVIVQIQCCPVGVYAPIEGQGEG